MKILVKPRAKYRVPWKSKEVREKRDCVEKACLLDKRKQTNADMLKLNKVLREVTKTHHKGQLEYIQGLTNKICHSVEDNLS